MYVDKRDKIFRQVQRGEASVAAIALIIRSSSSIVLQTDGLPGRSRLVTRFVQPHGGFRRPRIDIGPKFERVDPFIGDSYSNVRRPPNPSDVPDHTAGRRARGPRPFFSVALIVRLTSPRGGGGAISRPAAGGDEGSRMRIAAWDGCSSDDPVFRLKFWSCLRFSMPRDHWGSCLVVDF
ncbi:hypothetical protein EVAR_70996_1 [Eumeta japonica]|uniref:Uncharacterized protein n=1 Tax=Eumeta variegata TaxID=151549 RepID=A0A4C2A6H0_EUMVA|nr:hypothetical protein EVAR_70996_1 [Eumeta japonica]